MTDDERRERKRANWRAWRKRNPEKARAAVRRSRAKNPWPQYVWSLWRAELERNAPGGPFSHTRPDYLQRTALYFGRCSYCGRRKATCLDHAIPLSKGGTNHASNIRPACRSCNLSKGPRKLHYEWVPPLKRTSRAG